MFACRRYYIRADSGLYPPFACRLIATLVLIFSLLKYGVVLAHANIESSSAPYLTLKKALATAYNRSPLLQGEYDNARAMRGLFIQSTLYPNPELSLTAENLGGSGSYKGYESAETTLAITQPIPLGGRLYALQKAARADYQRSLAGVQVVKMQLYAAVGEAYVDTLYTEQWQKETEKLVHLHERLVHAIKQRVEAGAGATLELRLAEIRLGEVEIQKNKALRQASIERTKLSRLLGSETLIKNRLTDLGIQHKAWSWPELLQKLKQSPQLIAKQKEVYARRKAITAIKKEVIPDLNVQLGARHFSDDKQNAAVLAASALLPVRNRNQGRVISANAQFSAALKDLKNTHLQLNQELYTAFLQAQQARFEADLVTKKMLPLARQAVEVAQEGYHRGRYTYIELSTALSTLFEEEKHYQEAHADYHKALIRINAILGTDN